MYIRHTLNSLGNYLKDDYVNGFSMFWVLSLISPPRPPFSLSEDFVINEISGREARRHSPLRVSQNGN